MTATTSPHEFKPLRWWDRRDTGRCAHCLLPHYAHPVHVWVEARALGDKR